MKTLSFIIPAYNCQQYLDKCITSLISMDIIDELDVIIVNDGSIDKTEDIAEKYCAMYPKSIRLISQPNKGHGGSLNTGCAIATGKYLKVIDADDWIETQNLPEFIQMLKNCDSDVVLTHHYTINVSTNEIQKWKSYPMQFEKSYSMAEIISNWERFNRSITFHGITYKTSFYHQYGIQLSEHIFYEDHEFATIPCCYAKTITPLDIFIYNYRIGNMQQSVSGLNQLKHISHTETVLKRLISEFKQIPLHEDGVVREFICMKTKVLLLSYLTTVLLLVKDKKAGRQKSQQIMGHFKQEMPKVYELSYKQYRILCLMNYLDISKHTLDKLLNSKFYHTLKRDYDFN